MAVAFVKNVGSVLISMSTGGTVTVPAAGCAVDGLLVVRIAADSATSITDTGGNTYTRRITHTGSPWMEVWTAPITTALASGDTIVRSGNKTDGSLVVDEWSGQGAYETAGSSTGSGTAPSHTLTPATAGLLVGIVEMETTSGTITEDADTDGGDSWHSLTTVGAGGRRTSGAYKITTSAVSQTYNPTASAGAAWADAVVVYPAATDPRVPRFTPYPQLLAR